MVKRTVLFLFSLSLCSFLSAMQSVGEEKEGDCGTAWPLCGLVRVDTSKQKSGSEALTKEQECVRAAALKAASSQNKTKMAYGSTHFAIQ